MKIFQTPLPLLLTFFWVAFASPPPNERAFISCLVKHDSTISSIIYTPDNTTFLSTLNSHIQNARFINPETPRPIAILTPVLEWQIQTAISCAKTHHMEMRVRSGGHDFEGSSYISHVPFFILDMFNFQSISVEPRTKTAWVGVGATVGSTYYAVHSANSTLAFPAGFWPTVGVGGHLNGGGYGPLVRQFGFAANHIVDVRMIDVNGRVLNRASMGGDLFWAVRGGAGSNFGVIISYKVELVEVPTSVVGFYLTRTREKNMVDLVYKWQQIARSMPVELTKTVQISSIQLPSGERTIQADFLSAYRGGGANELPLLMQQTFPELGLTRRDCIAMPWVKSYPFLLGQSIDNLDVRDFLTNRSALGPAPSFKWKVDFAQDPIPPEGMVKIFRKLLEIPPRAGQYGWTIFGGGIMDTMPESEMPFPHRGKLMIMREIVFWDRTDSPSVVQSRVDWIRQVHGITGQYVPNNPRAQYANYRDLDLGSNNLFFPTSIHQARVWAYPYFKDNFYRLVNVKTYVDPQNFFKSEQSIPLLQNY